MLLDLLLGKTNPFAQWADQNSNLLASLGAGIGSGQNIQAGLSNAVSYLPQARQLDQAAAEKQKADAKVTAQENATQAWIKANYPQYADLPVNEGFQLALKDLSSGGASKDVTDTAAGRQQLAQQYSLSGNDMMNYVLTGKLPGGNQTARAGLGQPIILQNKATGERKPFMPMSDGTYMDPLTQQQADNSWQFDPSYVAAQQAAARAYGTAQGGAQYALPKTQMDVETELGNIAALRKDTQGINETFGSFGPIPQQMLPTMPGTPKADFKTRLDQIKGENFLNAYAALRGAGAITEVEGQKAQDAIGRMSTAQSAAAFNTALDDLEAVIKKGYETMKTQVSTPYTPPAGYGQQAPSTTSGPGYQVLSVE